MSGYESDMWRKSQCCGGQPEEIVQVDVYGDGRRIGLAGLTTIFDQLLAMGRAPNTSVKDELVKMVVAKNYVPSKDELIYGAALVREYAKFCAKKEEQSERQTSTR